MNSVRRVLILSVKAGAGHFRAAQAIEHAVKCHYPEVDVQHLDVLEFTSSTFRKGITDGYLKLAKDLPSIWGMIYDSFEEQSPKSGMKQVAGFFDRLNTTSLLRVVKKYDPDRIICTHYLPAEVLGPQRAKGKLRAPLFVALTDYDIHAMWVQKGVDHYFVATDEMAYALKVMGVGDAHIHVSGIPIMPIFAEPFPSREAMREKLGLCRDMPTILLSAGGFGMIRLDQVVMKLAERLPDAQFLTVAGSSRKLQKLLHDVADECGDNRIIPFGFVENIHELMAASDFMVAKSGGLTTSECLALGLPLVIIRPIPGQEVRNATFLLENGAGLWAHTAAHMIFKVEQLLHNPMRLAAMQAAARRIARPNAAKDIVNIVMQEGE